MRILFSIVDRAGCGWYRMILPARALLEHFSDVEVKVVIAPDEEMVDWADLVVFQRYHERHLVLLERVKKLGKPAICGTDDLGINISPDNPVWLISRADGRIENVKKFLHLVDYVTVSTPTLREMLLPYNSNIRVFRNMLDLTDYSWRLPKVEHKGTIIGWAGGSSHYEDLRHINSAINTVVRMYPDVKFAVGGYDRRIRHSIIKRDEQGKPHIEKVVKIDNPRGRVFWDEVLELFSPIGRKLIVLKGLPVEEYPVLFTTFDIVIAPLLDNQFNRCKSELKIIEAGAYKLPVVASSTGIYKEVIEHGVDGFLARNPKDFVKYLKILIENPDLRKEMGENLHQKVANLYDINKHIKERYEFYKSILGR